MSKATGLLIESSQVPEAPELFSDSNPVSNTPDIAPLAPRISLPPRPTRPSFLRQALPKKRTKTFHAFTEFPKEIRLLIWEAALPEGRVHELHPCTHLLEGGKMMFRSNHSTPPTLLSICHESRTIALQQFRLMNYDAPSGTKGIRKFYFNPRADTLFLNTLMGLYMAFMLLETSVDVESPLGRGVMQGWQNVALDADRAHLLDLLAGHHGHPAAPRLQKVFPDLKQFIIAFDFTKKGKTRFRTSVWPGENGTSLKILAGNTQCLERLFDPIVQFTQMEYSRRVDGLEEEDNGS